MVKDISAVFVMIGAEPNTGWLSGTVRLDNKGFILTGSTDGFEESPSCDQHAWHLCGRGRTGKFRQAGGIRRWQGFRGGIVHSSLPCRS
jgi:hypothetical protein